MTQSAIAIVGFYAALNTFILFWFVWQTSMLRGRHKIWIGDGGNAHLARVMRGHANAIENMPMMFVLLLAAALLGAPAVALHVLGAGFTIGRFFHAMHFIQADAPRWQRGVGYGLSFFGLLGAAGGVIAHAWPLVF